MPNDELKIRITADSTGLDKGLDESTKKLDNFDRKAEDSGKELENLSKQAEKGKTTITKAMDGLLKGISAAAVALGVAGIKFNASIESYQTSFEVLTGSAETAADMMEQLKQIAAGTPFELEGLAETTQLLMNYGFEGQEAIDMMMTLGDIAQGDADKLNRIATAYGQMSSAGKVSLEDVKQMIEAGFNPLQEISQSTGESMASLYDRISKGTIAVDEITASMQRSTSAGGKYFQSMEKQSKTLQGQWSTLKDTFSEAAGKVTKGISEWVSSKALPKAIQLVEEFGNNWQKVAVEIGTVVAAAGAMKVAMNFGDIAQNITAIGAALTGTSGIIGLVISALTLLVGSFVSAAAEANTHSAEYEAFQATLDTTKQKIEDLKTANETTNQTYEQTVASMQGTANMANDYIDRIEELQGKTNLTAAEQQEYNNKMDWLKQNIPGVNELISEETGQLEGGAQALRDQVQLFQERAKVQAMEQMLVELYQQQYTAQLALTEADQNRQTALENRNTAVAYGNELIAQATAITGEEYTSIEAAIAGLGEYQIATNGANTEVDGLTQQLVEQNTKIGETQQSLKDAAIDYNTAKGAVKDIDGQIQTLNNTMNTEASTADSTQQTVEDSVGDAQDSIDKDTTDMIGDIEDTGTALEDVTDSADAMDQGVTESSGNVEDSVRNMRAETGAEVGGMATDFTNAGSNAGSGLNSGMGSWLNSIKNTAKRLAQGALNSFKNFLGIHSPSRVFMIQGKFIGQGAVLGIESMFDKMKKAGEDLGIAVSESFQPDLSVPDISTNITPIMNHNLSGQMSKVIANSNNKPIILEIDGRVLAETTCDAINTLTVQTGSIPLRAY